MTSRNIGTALMPSCCRAIAATSSREGRVAQRSDRPLRLVLVSAACIIAASSSPRSSRNAKTPVPKGTEAKKTLRGTTLVGSGSARTPLCRATGVATKDRAPPGNEGDYGAAYWVLKPFGTRLTDPFGATGAPGLHHPRIAPPAFGGAYSLRSTSIRSSIAGRL